LLGFDGAAESVTLRIRAKRLVFLYAGSEAPYTAEAVKKINEPQISQMNTDQNLKNGSVLSIILIQICVYL